MNKASSTGLEDVVAAETHLSHVDGRAGVLWLAGHTVESLVTHHSFEAVAGLFLNGALPDPAALTATCRDLAEGRQWAFGHLDGLGGALHTTNAMDALRAGLAQLPEDTPPMHIAATVPVLAAAWARRQAGHAPLPPDPDAGHAADFLQMLHGDLCHEPDAPALDAYLCTVADHGLNASTFAARVVASTASDDVSAVVAAVGALKGRLHGGAPGPVLDMLDAIGRPENAREWLSAELDAGRRIMGMGHRVYRVRDPRAEVLERVLQRFSRPTARLEMARVVEHEAQTLLAERHPDRRLCANVEFYTAILLEAVGVPRALFTATFAVGRVLGWLAHTAEQRTVGRLIRPRARYIGPTP